MKRCHFYLVGSLWAIAGLLSCSFGYGQYENIWTFGQHGGLDFNSGAPVAIETAMTGTTCEASASVCNQEGQLLFYTEGSYIWDRDHNLMPNGEVLLPGDDGQSKTSSTTQGALIVPLPGSGHLYYVFSLVAKEYWTPPSYGRLYYSVVDMNLNGGRGDVVPGQKGILIDSMFLEKMTAVVGDNCNVWLLTAVGTAAFTSVFYAYELSSEGLEPQPVISEVGLGSPNFPIGVFAAAAARKRLVATQSSSFGGNEGVALFDFDPSSGIITNPQQLLPGSGAYGACFSPDDTKLYVNEIPLGGDETIVQFDLNLGSLESIISSKTVLCDAWFAQLKAAVDGRIYFRPGPPQQQDKLAAILYPNLSGIATQVDLDALQLVPETTIKIGLPNVVPVIPHDTFLTKQQVAAGCFSATTLVSANNTGTGWNYIWSTGEENTSIDVDTPGIYWVSYFSAPCNFHTDTFHVSFPYGFLPMLHVDTACSGSTNGNAYVIAYPGDTVPYTYCWLNGSDTLSTTDTLLSVAAGTYTLLIHTVHCDTSLQVIIPEVNYQVDFMSSDTLLCMGDTLQLTPDATTHFSQFTWFFGDGDSSLLAAPPGHLYAHPGRYELLLAASGPICKDTASTTITVDSSFAITFQMDLSRLCTGDGINFQLPDADSSFTGLLWDWGDGSYLQSVYANHFYHSFDDPGVWPVRMVLTARACPDVSFTDTVQVYALPEVNLGSDTSLCLDGSALVLHNLADAPDEVYHYLWNTGDTTASLSVLHPGSYRLSINTEPLGCTTTDVIEVTKDCYTDIPNAFTPNGDGDNDYFFPRIQLSQSISNFRLQVFSRWGQLLFETDRADGRGWDGRFNEQEQSLGVYVYLIAVTYTNGQKEVYKGNVTLVR